ncbi:MAG: hypothetical protein RL297_2394 [Pseudomonadota bacterium]|jgi:hypothetical protein
MNKCNLKPAFDTLWLIIVAVSAAILTACGGGGGGSSDTPPTTPPTTTTYTSAKTCHNGQRPTSTVSQAAADALVPNSCPAIPTTGVTVSVVGGVLVVNGLPSGVTIASSSLTATNGSSVVVYTNGALVSGTLMSGTYTYSGAAVTFTNAPAVTLAGTFLSPVPPPVVFNWPTDIKNLVEVGIVNGTVTPSLAITEWTTMSPYTQQINNSDDWKTNLKNGNVKILKSGEMAPDINGVQRNIWRAVFYNSFTKGWCMTPVHADNGTAYNGDTRTSVACYSVSIDKIIGVSDSVANRNGVINKKDNLCALNTVTRGDEVIPCPI